MIYWQFSQPTFLQKASMNTELTAALEKTLNQLDDIQVVHKNVSFSNTMLNGEHIVRFEAKVLPVSSHTSEPVEIENEVIEHMKETLNFPEKQLLEVYEVTVLRR